MSGMEMDDQTRRELAQFVEIESQKARFQGAVHQFTEMCFPKCISKPSSKLDRSEEACLVNCVERYLDTSNFFLKRLEELRH